jgi:diguanylate cyclase (GGDEF)-like protein
MAKKEYLLIIVCIALFLAVSVLSFSSIQQLQGNARVVNYGGIVRGGTQKLIKEELMNSYNLTSGVDYTDDKLIERLDGIVNELITGEGPNDLIVLNDEVYLDDMNQVKELWGGLKEEIYAVRGGKDPKTLFDLSQDYFDLVNQTVFDAEDFSERQVTRITNLLIVVNSVFVILIIVSLVLVIRSFAVRRRVDTLGKIAYVDPLTGMENRASCEREIMRIKESEESKRLAVLMFDMNNLKLANDFLGHQGGDVIIAKFAEIIRVVAKDYGFIGRYGGDEFLGIFENVATSKVEEYLERINEKVAEYNSLQVNDIEKIAFAVGYELASTEDTGIDDMIFAADKAMYVNKRKMKKTI